MFEPGQDVVVTLDGVEHPGEVIEASKGWVLTKVSIDMENDYGSLSDRLDPQSLFMVRDTNVRPMNEPADG